MPRVFADYPLQSAFMLYRLTAPKNPCHAGPLFLIRHSDYPICAFKFRSAFLFFVRKFRAFFLSGGLARKSTQYSTSAPHVSQSPAYNLTCPTPRACELASLTAFSTVFSHVPHLKHFIFGSLADMNTQHLSVHFNESRDLGKATACILH